MKRIEKSIAIIIACVMFLAVASTGIVLAYQKYIELPIGSNYAEVNGQKVKLDAPAQIINGRTMVPLRFIAENLNVPIEWNQEKRTVEIWYDDKDYYTKTLQKTEFHPSSDGKEFIYTTTLSTSKKYFRVKLDIQFKNNQGNVKCIVNNGAGVNQSQEFLAKDAKNNYTGGYVYYQSDGQEIFITISCSDVDIVWLEALESDYADFRK